MNEGPRPIGQGRIDGIILFQHGLIQLAGGRSETNPIGGKEIIQQLSFGIRKPEAVGRQPAVLLQAWIHPELSVDCCHLFDGDKGLLITQANHLIT